MSSSSVYRGRFAPSPTGPLHMGSLFAAVVSYLHAKAQDGEWLLRIEDIDPPREQDQAKDRIIETLSMHGFEWDDDISYQSTRAEAYERYLRQLAESNRVYFCPCSRKYLSEQNGRHSSACRQQKIQDMPCAIKFRSHDDSFAWSDGFQGPLKRFLAEDFVLKRKDGLYAYQLAVVVDDLDQGITHVVRGSDLIESTPMQLALYQTLGEQPPLFFHFPVIVASNGQKLSKQNLADAVDDERALENLLTIFRYLNLKLSSSPKTVRSALRYAIDAWKESPPNLTGEWIQEAHAL